MTFEQWINGIIGSENPGNNIIAYYFGIFETEDGYTLYLVGSAAYDADDPDWASNNDFEPADKYLPLPADFTPLPWEEVQNKIAAFLKDFTNSDSFNNSFFAKAKAIASGFDDGDLVLIK